MKFKIDLNNGVKVKLKYKVFHEYLNDEEVLLVTVWKNDKRFRHAFCINDNYEEEK